MSRRWWTAPATPPISPGGCSRWTSRRSGAVELSGQTLAIVVSATLLSVMISVPLALLAAATRHLGEARGWAPRALIVLARAVPDVVFAIVFFRVFGLGA